ncbi:MAG: hypothetical protein K6A40_11370 [Solobacterium sp.]|nr:hypothetical protein [Solobacterium sp.]
MNEQSPAEQLWTLTEQISQKLDSGCPYEADLLRLRHLIHENLPSEIREEMGECWDRFRRKYSDLVRKLYRQDSFAVITPEEAQTVFQGSDLKKQKKILFDLEECLDPWRSAEIPWIREAGDLLEQVIVSTGDEDIAEYAAEILRQYGYPPYLILEEYLDELSEDIRLIAEDLLEEE